MFNSLLLKKTQTILFFYLLLNLFSATSQSTRLVNSLCNGNISGLGANLTCIQNTGQGHRFEISKTDGTVLDVYDAIAGNQAVPSRSKYAFRFTWLNGCNIGYGTTYRIRVSWFNGITWSAYGSYCEVTTPAVAMEVSTTFCGTTVSSLGVNILASTNQMCGHRWEVRDLSNNIIGVYDALSSSVSNPGRSPYNFRFTWMPFGTIQSATTYKLQQKVDNANGILYTSIGSNVSTITAIEIGA
jgi:hypothetical protein